MPKPSAPKPATKPAPEPRPPTPKPDHPSFTLEEVREAMPKEVAKLARFWTGRGEAITDALARFIALLLETNRIHNLTGDRTPEAQWRGHAEDALRAARLIEETLGPPEPGMKILDAGSGGGMPGLAWAIVWPEAKVVLVESVGKKVAYLRAAAEALGLTNVEVLGDRLEELGRRRDHREQYDLVTARALAQLAMLGEWTVPFARVEGTVAAIKGAQVEEEIKAGRPAFACLGAEAEPTTIPYARSDEKGSNLLLYRKLRPTPQQFPRVGFALAKGAAWMP